MRAQSALSGARLSKGHFSLLLASIPPAYVAPFERAWRHRELIRAVVRREFISRFRGSLLGPLWAVLSPLIMLLTYTVLFSITVPQLSAGMSAHRLCERDFHRAHRLQSVQRTRLSRADAAA